MTSENHSVILRCVFYINDEQIILPSKIIGLNLPGFDPTPPPHPPIHIHLHTPINPCKPSPPIHTNTHIRMHTSTTHNLLIDLQFP